MTRFLTLLCFFSFFSLPLNSQEPSERDDLKRKATYAIFFAAETNNVEVIEAAVLMGGDVNAVYGGITPLMNACKTGSLDAVKKLIELKARKNTRDFLGRTAIDYAELYKHKNVAQYLAKEGALGTRYSIFVNDIRLLAMIYLIDESYEQLSDLAESKELVECNKKTMGNVVTRALENQNYEFLKRLSRDTTLTRLILDHMSRTAETNRVMSRRNVADMRPGLANIRPNPSYLKR